MKLKFSKTVAAIAVAFSAGSASAAMQTLEGVAFDVTYDDALLGLFGTPTFINDTLFFNPSEFVASSSGGFDLTNSTLALTVTANDGYVLNGFGLVEEGDYFYFDGGAVAVGGQLRVKTLDPLVSTTTDALSIGSTAPTTMATFGTTDWTADAYVGTANATTAFVTIENLLLAQAAQDSLAFIEKKGVQLNVSTAPVPEPETYAMMLAGLGMLGFVARRRMDRM